MRYIASAVLMASLAAMPALAAAQSSSTKPASTTNSSTKPASATKSASNHAEHSVRGVIKSIDTSSMLLGGTGKKSADTTFVLNQSTQREGTLAVGSTVSVRYHEDAGSKIATAVIAQPAKEAKSSSTSKSSTTTKTKS